jgi:hypothetical protein
MPVSAAAMSVAVPPTAEHGLPSTQSPSEQLGTSALGSGASGAPNTIPATTERDSRRPEVFEESTGRMELDEEIARSLDRLGPGTPGDSDRPRGLVFRTEEVTQSALSHPQTARGRRDSAPAATERSEPSADPSVGLDDSDQQAAAPMTVPQDLSSADVLINIEDSVHDVSSLDVESTHASATFPEGALGTAAQKHSADGDTTKQSAGGLELLEQTLSRPQEESEMELGSEPQIVDDDEIEVSDDLSSEMVDVEEIREEPREETRTQIAGQPPRNERR